MPLTALWGYVALAHVEETPPIFWLLWTLSGAAMVTTTIFTLLHILKQTSNLGPVLDEGGHAVTPFNLQLSQTISALPVFTCGLAYTCLFVPAQAFAVELAIAIFSCIALGSLAQYALHALGAPPIPAKLLKKVPKKRWWCGSLCGGLNDPLPGLGLMWSKEPHRLTLKELRFAFHMVAFFIWSFIIMSAWQAGLSMFPTAVEKRADGWCYSYQLLQGSADTVLKFCLVSTTLIGASGFSIISGAVSMALKEGSQQDEEYKVEIGKKAAAGMIYLQLPLLKVLVDMIPMGMAAPTVSVAITSSTVSTGRSWTTSGTTIDCPVYDQQVMGPMIYCTIVTFFMAYTSYSNFMLYADHGWNAERLQQELVARLRLDEGDSEAEEHE
eukprot:CAMPEP_0197652564 /NCGR_PEP_ID=MMETSP1338-20131121/34529_1 /TAXON_ID=43686 ORGANISM="Pelagodinium beii, Strain RCC1491" /NCGR_SAMPLE_ID=MMETSP1338 /ASSEMBLY_ACC=CAM_ASM_000754 /LENGTH=382 /DNA_ID=CAMNT_0043227471 /DNA_START=74 /DNA_END=1219 /DNA_ORIENTATION=+